MNIFYLYLLISIKKILSIPICIESKNNCRKCNLLTNICAICEIKDILLPDNNGRCIGSEKCIIGKNYCKECSQEGKSCKTCETNFFPDKNGGCSYSMNCKLSYKGVCFECEDEYILIGNNEFKMCKYIFSDDLKNCQKINNLNGNCEICEDNYFLSEGDKKCTKIENCFETIFGKCDLCIEGFYLDIKEDKCFNKTDTLFELCKQTVNGEKCDICDDGLYFDENGLCTFSNFSSESLNGNCKKCIKDYYLANNYFCSNEENCYNADKDTGICLLCNEHYFLDDKDYKCKSNLDDNEFKYCRELKNNICIKCDSSYYMGKDNKCSKTKNCEESENGKCILCSENYYLTYDGFCSNVEHCIYTSYNGECRECEDDYYYSLRYKYCIEANVSNIFYGCKFANIFEEYCLECKDNFYFNYNKSLCFDNSQEGRLYKCAYSDDNGELCEVCIDNYYLGSEDQKCSLIENCKKSENVSVCLECDDYFCLDVKNQRCIDNNFLEDDNIKIYFACKRTNEKGTGCEECIEGYKINEEGYCIDVENCEVRQEDGKCLKCKNKVDSNGNIINYCANDIFGCVEIKYSNCLKCNNLTKIYACTECKEGYNLSIYGECLEK